VREELTGYAFLVSLAFHILIFSGLIPFPTFPATKEEKEVCIDVEMEPVVPVGETPPSSFPKPLIEGQKPNSPSLPSLQREEVKNKESRKREQKITRAEKQIFRHAEFTSETKNLPPASAPPVFEKPLSVEASTETDGLREKIIEKEIEDAMKEVGAETLVGTVLESKSEEGSPVDLESDAAHRGVETTKNVFAEAEKMEGGNPADFQTLVNKAPGPPPREAGTPISEAQALLAYAGMIRKKIEEKKRYPPWARRNGWQGRVVLDFAILNDGRLKEVTVVGSSGHRILEEAAKEAIEKANPYPPPPMKGKDLLRLRIPIVFRLEGEPGFCE
jgi:TonB family protein